MKDESFTIAQTFIKDSLQMDFNQFEVVKLFTTQSSEYRKVYQSRFLGTCPPTPASELTLTLTHSQPKP